MTGSFASDTSEEVTELLVARWRAMSTTDKAELVSLMCAEADAFARRGIAFRYGDVSPARERYLMAARRYGAAFAEEYYGERSPFPAPDGRVGPPAGLTEPRLTEPA